MGLELPKVTEDEIRKYITIVGKRGSGTITVMQKMYPYLRAIVESEIGWNLLKSDMERHEELLFKMYRETITPDELAQLRYLRDVRFPSTLPQLQQYLDIVKEVRARAI